MKKNVRRLLSALFLSFCITGLYVDSVECVHNRHRHWRRGRMWRRGSWVAPTIAFGVMSNIANNARVNDVVSAIRSLNNSVKNLNERLDNVEQRLFILENRIPVNN